MNKATVYAFSKTKVPEEKIQQIIADCGGDFSALRLSGIFTEPAKHGKEKHNAFTTKYTASFSGIPCEYRYSYCPECNIRFGRQAVLFDYDANHAYVFDERKTSR